MEITLLRTELDYLAADGLAAGDLQKELVGVYIDDLGSVRIGPPVCKGETDISTLWVRAADAVDEKIG